MNFRKLIPEDQSLINEYIKYRNNFQTDYSIASLILFEEFKNPEISIQEKCIIIRGFVRENEVIFFSFCKLEYFNTCINNIISYFKQKDKPYIIVSNQFEYIKESLKNNNIIPDKNFFDNYGTIKSEEFILYNERDDAEYIYLPKNLIDLEGNKYRKLREKINLFKKEYPNYEIIEYNKNENKNIIDLLIIWNEDKNFDYLKDLKKLNYLIDNKEKLELNIYLLKVNNIIIGITIIQILANNVGVVLYEKCNKKYKNANIILTQFEAQKFKNCRGISKQEDLGIDGLRQVKLSYKPFTFEKKFHIYQYNENEFFKLYKNIFGDSDNLINLVRNSTNYNEIQSSFVLKNQKIVSIGGTREKNLRFFNNIENVPFIFGIATKEEERKKGYAGNVLRMILNKIYLYRYTYNIAMIAPEEEHLIKYYEKFGFVKFNYTKKIPVINLFKKNFEIKIGNLNDSQEITNLFQQYTKKYQIGQYRDIQFTTERLKEVFAEEGKLFILSINNINYGYFIYEQVIITEHINLLENEENEKIEVIQEKLSEKNLDFILDCKTIDIPATLDEFNSSIGYTYSLIRIISPENFVKKYFEYIDFGEKTNDNNINKNIIVKDNILGESIFNVKKINGKKYFSKIVDKDAVVVELSVSELMKKILINFKNNCSYEIKDKFFFTERW